MWNWFTNCRMYSSVIGNSTNRTKMPPEKIHPGATTRHTYPREIHLARRYALQWCRMGVGVPGEGNLSPPGTEECPTGTCRGSACSR